MAKRFNRATDKTWQNVIVRKDVIQKKYRKFNGRVMFPSSHDIFNFPRIKESCFTVLSNLLESGNEVLVTTKPRLSIIQEIDELFGQHQERLQFRFTITSKNDRLLKFWEPNAPNFHERIKSLKFAFRKKYKTSVSIEPFLDYYPQALVKYVEPYCTESIWVGKMNYIPRNDISKRDTPFYEQIRRNYEPTHLKEIYYQLRNLPIIRFKDSIRNILNSISVKYNYTRIS